MPDNLLDKPTVYGTRAKIGIIVPPTNTTNEAEWQQLLPDGVTLHTARMPLHTDTATESGRAALYCDIEHHAGQLALADVDVIVYGCTAGSLVTPVDALAQNMTRHTGVPAVTTAQAITQALLKLDVNKLVIATPYHDALTNHERDFFADSKFDVVNAAGLGYGEHGPDEFRNIARVQADTVMDLVSATDRPDADAILLSCTDLATLSIVDRLEAKHGKPVISSNSATLWAALRLAGIDDGIVPGGTLLRDH